MVFFINILIVIFFVSSCKREIPESTHEFLRGTWAKEGFTDSLRRMHCYHAAFESMDDHIGFINIDISNDNGCDMKKYGLRKYYMNSAFMDPNNPDSLTDEERYSKNSIWILEDNQLDYKNAFRLYYKGNNYFLSEPLTGGDRKYLKIVSVKDKRLEYGLLDKNSQIKSKRYLELLFRTDKWFYERFDYGWEELYMCRVEYLDFLDNNIIYGTKRIDLYKKDLSHDSLLRTYSIKDFRNNNGIILSSRNVWIKYLESIMKPVDWEKFEAKDIDDAEGNCSLTWKGDTATLKNKRLDGDYYIVLKK